MPITLTLFNLDRINLKFDWIRHILSIYSDLIAVILLVTVYLSYNHYQHQSRMELIHQPKVNDFYFIDYHAVNKSSNVKYRYVPIKILSINQDTIEFKLGNIAHTTPISGNDHVKFDAPMRRNYYRKDNLIVPRQTILEWVDTGILYDIARPRNVYINGSIVMPLRDLIPED
ncbi:hypothetical protein [Paraglaciecola sp.]|uniref:hypothetical protein n=1 Tax=Paraglaciecola sp. TaxID=1920173 RepID=UPI003EF20DC2